MDILPSGGIFRELQAVHDTGYFSGQASLEEDWQQVFCILHFLHFFAFLQICPPVPQWPAIGLVWWHGREREAEKFRHIRYLAEFLPQLTAS